MIGPACWESDSAHEYTLNGLLAHDAAGAACDEERFGDTQAKGRAGTEGPQKQEVQASDHLMRASRVRRTEDGVQRALFIAGAWQFLDHQCLPLCP
jgi:hypothetical protein